MNVVETAAARADRELTPLDPSTLMVAPVLTPVAVAVVAGLAAGAVVGYVDRARHGSVISPSHHAPSVDHAGDLGDLPVAGLLQARADAMGA